MFSSSSSSSSNHFSSMSASSIGSSSATNASSAKGIQSLEKRVVYTSKEEVEKKLASILLQVQQNQISSLDLTPLAFGEQKTSALASASCLGSGGGSVQLTDYSSFSCLSTLEGHSDPVYALAVLPNGSLASASEDNTIKLWDTSSGRCLSTLTGHSKWVYALAVLPNGSLASGSSDNTIKLWDSSSGRCLSTLTGHSSYVSALAVLPNGSLASGSGDKTIKLWDTSSGRCLSTLEGHSSSVWALAVLSNGSLASGSGDMTIKLWDSSSERCLSTLTGHFRWVWALAVLPNGSLASGSEDNTIKLWEPKAKAFSLVAQQVQPVLKALKNNASITSLDLSGHTEIADDIVESLIGIFKPGFLFSRKPNTTLKSIDLRHTGITQNAVQKLEKELQKIISTSALTLLTDWNKAGRLKNEQEKKEIEAYQQVLKEQQLKKEKELKALQEAEAKRKAEIERQQAEEQRKKEETERQLAEEKRRKEQAEKVEKERQEREAREKVEREQAERRKQEAAERKAAEEKVRAEKERKERLAALRLQIAQKEKAAAEAKKKQEEEEEIRRLEAQMKQLDSAVPASTDDLDIPPPPLSESDLETPTLPPKPDLQESKEQKHTSASSSQSSTGSSGSSFGVAHTMSPSDIKELQASFLLPYDCLSFGQTLGEGGFGVVYQGTYRAGEVAIKKLLVKKMTTSGEEEFKNEISIMARSKHPNIVTLYGYTLAPHYCMIMEKMHTSLYSVLQNSSVDLSWSMRTTIAMDIIAGLWQLHESNILHRDLKSLNVLLSSTMRAKLADFGLSKVKSETKTTTKTHEGSVGTVQWMAPELFGLKPKYSRASDIYAYAMVLWELVTRQVPYADANAQVIIAEVRQGNREEIPTDCPLRFSSLIQFCWMQDAAQRPSAKDVCTYWQSEEKEFKLKTAVPTGASNLSSQVISNLASLRS